MEKSSFESMQEFFYLWLKTYEATFGRLAEMPAMGPTREKSEKMMKTEIDEINKELDSLKKTVKESNLKTMNLPTKTEIDEINKELDSLKGTVKEKTMDLPTKTEIDEINKELDSLKGTVKENTMDLPTKTEIDEINKELDSLKGTVGELTSQIKEYLMNPPKKGEYSGIHKTKKK